MSRALWAILTITAATVATGLAVSHWLAVVPVRPTHVGSVAALERGWAPLQGWADTAYLVAGAAVVLWFLALLAWIVITASPRAKVRCETCGWRAYGRPRRYLRWRAERHANRAHPGRRVLIRVIRRRLRIRVAGMMVSACPTLPRRSE